MTQNSPITESGEFDVILSPEFYWVKKVALPVKKISAAKKLAASVYEGSLPAGEYTYEVSKLGDEFVIIAFDKERVSTVLKEKFTQGAKISGVYFAQNEFSELSECCGVDEDNSLVNLNGLLMQIPRKCTESKKEIGDYLKDKKLSTHKITLGAFESSVISSKTVSFLAAGVLFLLVSNVIDWVNYQRAVSMLEDQRAEITSEYGLPQTSMQLKSIKKGLIKTYTTQKKIRDEVFSLQSIVLKKGEYIERIKSNAKETEVVIKVESAGRESAIKSALQRKLNVKSAEFDKTHLTLKIAS
ncbi:MAG: hypothetical protein K0U47_00025 [Epsilonproteobacteria bacterium]|nr:hypothetical protein [Campylobacterota bacterium]